MTFCCWLEKLHGELSRWISDKARNGCTCCVLVGISLGIQLESVASLSSSALESLPIVSVQENFCTCCHDGETEFSPHMMFWACMPQVPPSDGDINMAVSK